MQLLFKVSNTGGEPPTVGHSNFLDHYSAINHNTAWATIKNSIRRATNDYLVPHISQEMYEAILEVYHGTEELTNEQSEFLLACQDVVAYYTMLYVAPELNVSAGEMGMVEKGSSGTPTMPVAQWRYKEFKYDLTKKADKMLDGVIRLLEKYIHDEFEFFAPWKVSAAYLNTRTVFFQSAQEFDRYVKINGSRRLFSQISKDILRIEEDIDKIICEEQFNELIAGLQDGDADDDQKALIERIRRYVAPKAMAAAAPLLYLNLDTHGLSLSSYSDGIESNNTHSSMFRGAESVGAFVQKLRMDADFEFKVMMNFIHSKINNYPLIKDSACYARYNASTRSGPIDVGPGGIMI